MRARKQETLSNIDRFTIMRKRQLVANKKRAHHTPHDCNTAGMQQHHKTQRFSGQKMRNQSLSLDIPYLACTGSVYTLTLGLEHKMHYLE